MKSKILVATLALGFVVNSEAFSQDKVAGEKLFKSKCASCHAIGKKVVGPDLKGVVAKRKEAWLLSFIKSSQTMVKKGDADAVKIFTEFKKIPMPDQKMPDGDIKSILAFIKSKS